MLHHRTRLFLGTVKPEEEVDQFDVPQHAGAHAGEYHVRSVLPFDEEHCHLGSGGDVDSAGESHLRRIHCLHHLLDGRTAQYAHAGSLGHCGWSSSRCLPFEIALGLLVVVLHLHLGWSSCILLHPASV